MSNAVNYRGRAAFSVEAFLSNPWFTLVYRGAWPDSVSARTLDHKVITLEHYLGVGSFFVMLPSYLRTLERWTRHTALWHLTCPKKRQMDQVNQITRRVLRKVTSLSPATLSGQAYSGLDHLDEPLKHGTRAPVTTRGAYSLPIPRPGTYPNLLRQETTLVEL